VALSYICSPCDIDELTLKNFRVIWWMIGFNMAFGLIVYFIECGSQLYIQSIWYRWADFDELQRHLMDDWADLYNHRSFLQNIVSFRALLQKRPIIFEEDWIHCGSRLSNQMDWATFNPLQNIVSFIGLGSFAKETYFCKRDLSWDNVLHFIDPIKWNEMDWKWLQSNGLDFQSNGLDWINEMDWKWLSAL